MGILSLFMEAAVQIHENCDQVEQKYIISHSIFLAFKSLTIV